MPERFDPESEWFLTPDGKKRMCSVGTPGSVHDSALAERSGINRQIDEMYREDGGQVVGDSALGKHNTDAMVKSAAIG